MIEGLAAIYILLTKAGRLLSTRPSAATMNRWASRGSRGVVLRT